MQIITIYDNRYGTNTPINYIPNTSTGWMFWGNECREIIEVHTTQRGIQIELLR
jgi:hypothetical protein